MPPSADTAVICRRELFANRISSPFLPLMFKEAAVLKLTAELLRETDAAHLAPQCASALN